MEELDAKILQKKPIEGVTYLAPFMKRGGSQKDVKGEKEKNGFLITEKESGNMVSLERVSCDVRLKKESWRKTLVDGNSRGGRVIDEIRNHFHQKGKKLILPQLLFCLYKRGENACRGRGGPDNRCIQAKGSQNSGVLEME